MKYIPKDYISLIQELAPIYYIKTTLTNPEDYDDDGKIIAEDIFIYDDEEEEYQSAINTTYDSDIQYYRTQSKYQEAINYAFERIIKQNILSNGFQTQLKANKIFNYIEIDNIAKYCITVNNKQYINDKNIYKERGNGVYTCAYKDTYNENIEYKLRVFSGWNRILEIKLNSAITDTDDIILKISKCVGRRQKQLTWASAKDTTSYAKCILGTKYKGDKGDYPQMSDLPWLQAVTYSQYDILDQDCDPNDIIITDGIYTLKEYKLAKGETYDPDLDYYKLQESSYTPYTITISDVAEGTIIPNNIYTHKTKGFISAKDNVYQKTTTYYILNYKAYTIDTTEDLDEQGRIITNKIYIYNSETQQYSSAKNKIYNESIQYYEQPYLAIDNTDDLILRNSTIYSDNAYIYNANKKEYISAKGTPYKSSVQYYKLNYELYAHMQLTKIFKPIIISNTIYMVDPSEEMNYKLATGQKYNNSITYYKSSSQEVGLLLDEYVFDSNKTISINLNNWLLNAIKPAYLSNNYTKDNTEVRFIGQRNKSLKINPYAYSGNLTFKFNLIQIDNNGNQINIFESPFLLKIGTKNNKNAKKLTANSLLVGDYYCTLK